MSKRLFTEEEIAVLEQNPCVERVTARSVHFTVEFKTKYRALRQGGTSVWDALKQLGIPWELLGERRVRSMDDRILSRIGDFTEKAEKSAAQTETERIRRLEEELTYTKQEVAFLKKLQLANMEARKAWESKHPRA